MRYELMRPKHIREAIEKRWPVILPLGVLEYHSEHLPVGMDTLAVIRCAELLEKEMDLVLLPPFYYGSASFAVDVTGRYLYGAPAAGNRFSATMAVSVERHPVEGMPDHFFGDPTVELPREAREVIDAELDADGRLVQEIDLPGEARPVTPIAAVVTGLGLARLARRFRGSAS